MARMIAIGPERFALSFGALGFEMHEAAPEDFLDVLGKLSRDRTVGLIVCGESYVEKARPDFKEIYEAARAAILVVPDGPEAKGVGREITRSSIELAAGVDLLSSTESQKDKAASEAKQE